MNKKIIIIVSIVIFAIAGFTTLFILNNNSTPTIAPANYNILFTENNGNITAKLFIDTKIYTLTAENISTFGITTYNSTKDLLWVECPNGYQIKNPLSSSHNKIFNDPILKASNMELKQGSQNIIQITCQK